MSLKLYKKCVDDMAGFKGKIKVLRFVGIGEPLLHKDIVEMVSYTSSRKIADKIEMLTNAALLTPKMSDALLSAGLSRLVISLQGTSAEKYKQVSGVDIDFDGLVENLKYFFEHKGNAELYIKIIDCGLEGEDDKKRFYELFGDICDTIAVEYAVPIHTGVEYEGLLKQKVALFTQFGLPVGEVKICPQPFFTMQINPDGKVVPCYSFEYPQVLGDCNNQSVCEIWNGSEFRRFRRMMLDGAKNVCGTCRDCSIIKYRLFPEDVLNDDADRLKGIYVM
jgi:radical SAM protein with 4Fe4S-binding SPASM domain